MEDEALGLAWVEAIEVLPGGRQTLSVAHPVFLTTRCDVCEEFTSLFAGCKREQRREMAGVLKDLEELFHPLGDPEAPLDPTLFGPLVILCIWSGFHRTLDEIADEIAYRGPEGGLRCLGDAAQQMCPHPRHNLRSLAALSGCKEAMHAVLGDLVPEEVESKGRQEGHAPTSPLYPNALMMGIGGGRTEGKLSSSSIKPYCGDTTCPSLPLSTEPITQRLVGLEMVNLLKNPAAVVPTIVASGILFSAFPWSLARVSGHVLLTILCLHVYLPCLYDVIYLRGVAQLHLLARAKGVMADAGELRLCDSHLSQQYAAYAFTCINSNYHRGAFLVWGFCSATIWPLLSLQQLAASSACFGGAVAAVGVVQLGALVIRERMVRAGRGVPDLRRNQALPLLLTALHRLVTAMHGHISPCPTLSVLEPRVDSHVAWASLLVFGTLLFAGSGVFQGLTCCPPLREMGYYRAVYVAMCTVGTYLTLAVQSSRDGDDGACICDPGNWVTWALMELPTSMSFIAARVWLEVAMLKEFLRKHVPGKLE